MTVATKGVVLPGEIPPEAAVGAAHGTVAQTAIERAIGAVAAVVGSALVVIEVIILLWGVTTRYVLEAPSLWTDETAIILFIWLTWTAFFVAVGVVVLWQVGVAMIERAAASSPGQPPSGDGQPPAVGAAVPAPEG